MLTGKSASSAGPHEAIQEGTFLAFLLARLGEVGHFIAEEHERRLSLQPRAVMEGAGAATAGTGGADVDEASPENQSSVSVASIPSGWGLPSVQEEAAGEQPAEATPQWPAGTLSSVSMDVTLQLPNTPVRRSTSLEAASRTPTRQRSRHRASTFAGRSMPLSPGSLSLVSMQQESAASCRGVRWNTFTNGSVLESQLDTHRGNLSCPYSKSENSSLPVPVDPMMARECTHANELMADSRTATGTSLPNVPDQMTLGFLVEGAESPTGDADKESGRWHLDDLVLDLPQVSGYMNRSEVSNSNHTLHSPVNKGIGRSKSNVSKWDPENVSNVSLRSRSVMGVPTEVTKVCTELTKISFKVLPLWEDMQRDATSRLNSISSTSRAFSGLSHDEENLSRWWPFVPANSIKRVMWDLVSVLFILHDAAVAPLGFMEVPESSVSSTLAWCARLFWTFDIVASFLTGFLRPDGSSEVRPSKIALNYASTWLAPDTILVVSDWIRVIMTNTTGFFSSVITALRMMRMVRLLRLQRICSWFLDRSWSERLFLLSSILKSTGAVICVAHTMTCLWIGIGLRGSAHWVERRGLEKDQHLEQYMLAFHWALTNFAGSMDLQPHSATERCFAIFSLLIGFLIASWFVSSFTSSMTRLSMISSKNSMMFTVLHKFLREHGISTGLARRIQLNAANAIMEQQLHVHETDVELLRIVSEPLRAELHLEIHSPTLTTHALFARIQAKAPRALQNVCHTCVAEIALEEGDVVFSRGEVPDAPKMLFVISGKLEYTQDGLNKSIVSSPQWICEPVLWTQWVFHGNLLATTASRFIAINAVQFWHLAQRGQITNLNLGQYAAAYIKRINTRLSMRSELGSVPECLQIVSEVYGGGARRASTLSAGSLLGIQHSNASGPGASDGATHPGSVVSVTPA